MSNSTTLYLDLLKLCLTNFLNGATEQTPVHARTRLKQKIVNAFAARGIQMVRPSPFDPALRAEGRDEALPDGSRYWPPYAESMIGLKRLDNLQFCIEDALTQKIPGDLIETGVWRGGATIFMRAVLKAHGVSDRLVWVADSFEGLPRPNDAKYPQDAGDVLFSYKELKVSVEQVQANFRKYDLLDDQVRFLKGWFRDSLPHAPIKALAVLRLDGDMYESTIDALTHLYPKLSVGGYVIVDDYGAIPACRKAVHDFRESHGIEDEMREIDWTGVYWQRLS